MCIHNSLSVKHFHGVSAGDVYECSLKLNIGIVRVLLLNPTVAPALCFPGRHRTRWGGTQRLWATPRYPARPEPNFRSVHALIGPEDNIIVPKECSGAVQPEGQLAVVMGKKARNVSRENALEYIFGYSIGNDISQRKWQGADRTMFRGKNCDTFKPFGPWIVTGLDPTQFRIIVRHNGTVWEDFSSADQIWDAATWILELSRYTTRHPCNEHWYVILGYTGEEARGYV